MELLCPHCFKRVSVPDERAGQVINCPLCSKPFGAPALTPPMPGPPAPPPPMPAPPPIPSSILPPAPAPISAPPDNTYGLASAPIPPPSSYAPTSAPSPLDRPAPAPKPAPPPPPPPLPPGEYTGSHTMHMRADVLDWIAPACLTLVFVLSFFHWHTVDRTTDDNLWGLAFTEGLSLFIAYVIFTIFLAWPLSIAAILVDQRIVPTPPSLTALMPWKWALVGALTLLGFVLLFYDVVDANFNQRPNPMLIAMKLAWRIHLVALITCGLQVWMQMRRLKNLPPPKMEVRW